MTRHRMLTGQAVPFFWGAAAVGEKRNGLPAISAASVVVTASYAAGFSHRTRNGHGRNRRRRPLATVRHREPPPCRWSTRGAP